MEDVDLMTFEQAVTGGRGGELVKSKYVRTFTSCGAARPARGMVSRHITNPQSQIQPSAYSYYVVQSTSAAAAETAEKGPAA